MLLINYTIIYTFHVKATLHEHAYYKKKTNVYERKKNQSIALPPLNYTQKKKQ